MYKTLAIVLLIAALAFALSHMFLALGLLALAGALILGGIQLFSKGKPPCQSPPSKPPSW